MSTYMKHLHSQWLFGNAIKVKIELLKGEELVGKMEEYFNFGRCGRAIIIQLSMKMTNHTLHESDRYKLLMLRFAQAPFFAMLNLST